MGYNIFLFICGWGNFNVSNVLFLVYGRGMLLLLVLRIGGDDGLWGWVKFLMNGVIFFGVSSWSKKEYEGVIFLVWNIV